MYFGKKQQLDWTFALVVGDLLACLLAQLVVVFLFPQISGFSAFSPWPSGVIFLILVLVFVKYIHLYSWPSFRQPVSKLPRLGVAIALATFSYALLFKIFGRPWDLALTFWLATLFGCTVILLLLTRILVYFLLSKILHAVQIETIAFVNGSVRLDRVISALTQELGPFHRAAGYFSDTPLEENNTLPYRWLGPIGKMEEHLDKENVTLLIVEENTVSIKELEQIAAACGRAIVSLKVIPSVFDFWSTRLSFRTIAGIPLMGVFDLRHDRFHNKLIKRFVDIVGALVGLTIFSPLIAVLGVMVYLESPGPVFFRQRRAGLNGIPFEIIKIRSMRIDAESASGQVWAVEGDPRRLKIGKIIRSWNLDELPQFWNVLKGDMSLVGPRPEMYDLVQDFRQTIRNYSLRHTMRPGLTGWAAVNGLRGNTSLVDRIEYDLFYIEHWSLRLDAVIIAMTIRPPKNAY